MKKVMSALLYIVPFSIIILIWFYYPSWIFHDFAFGELIQGKKFIDELGGFGDVYGALNTLFSGLAFAGVIVSIRLQSKELSETRDELKAQVVQFKRQTATMQKQVFESTFFKMIELHNSISSSIKEKRDFSSLFEALIIAAMMTDPKEEFKGDRCIDFLREIYAKFMKSEYSSLGHYFRYLYQIIKFIDVSDLSKADKTIYVNILRSQLSSHEILLLFVNCLCYARSEKFKILVETYSFFEHIYEEDLDKLLLQMNNHVLRDENGALVQRFDICNLIMLYSPRAYGLPIIEN